MEEPIKVFPPTKEEREEQLENEAKELERRLNAFAARFKK